MRSTGLLIVSLVTVLAGVAGVVVVAKSATDWSVVVAMIVLLVGLTLVVRTMTGQLADADGGRGDEHL